MGLWDSAKDFYYGLEEKYYDFLDAVNEKVPVYSIIDPIDKVMPSFLLFIGLFLLLIILAVFYATESLGVNDTFTISVSDSGGGAIEGAGVTFLRNSEVLGTRETDALGIAKITGIRVDDEIEVIAEKSGYTTFRNTFFIFELPQAENITLQDESAGFETKTIRLVDSLGQPVREAFTLKFRCSNPYAPSIPNKNITQSDNGIATVEVPNTCETLRVDVTDADRFAEIFGKVIVGDDETIFLEEETTPKGKINVNVSDEGGSPLNGIQVEIYKHSELLDNPNVGPISVDFTFSGSASFDVFPGAYIVRTYDPQGVYGEKQSERISVQAGSTQTVALALGEEIMGQIRLRVVDKSNGTEIEGARVTLFYSGSDEELTSLETDGEGKAEFNISRDVEYKAIATAEGYKIGRISGLRIGANYVDIEMEKCTPSTCGALRVQVIDQDGNPVENATVVLYSASTNFIAGYENRTSDINGVAQFNNVSTGNYYAFAFKEGFSGKSDTAYFSGDPSQATGITLTVTMEVGDGIIRLVAQDREGRSIPFATFGVFDARTNELIGRDLTDADGVKEITMRANKKVYLVVSKEDSEGVYTNYITAKRKVIVDTVQEFRATLERPIIGKDIEIEFLGLYSGNLRAQNVKAGETYNARFKLRVPEDKDYDEVGVHLRTGQDVLMEKDELLIKEVNAPRTSQIRATRFEPEQSNLSEEDYELTNADAKWVNLRWNSGDTTIVPGVYEIEAEIMVKGSASLGDKLHLFYRAWAENEEDRERFPIDATVLNELYSNVNQEIFQVGIVTLCDSDFCFTATITDLEDQGEGAGIIENVTESYNAKIFNQYKLQFGITNNSETRIHNNANLRITNPDESIKFFDYTIVNAQTQPIAGTLNGFTFPRFNIGNMQPKNSLRFEADFTTQKAVNGVVNIRIVSDQAIVFEKNLNIIVGAPRELRAEVEPKFYLSGVQNDIEVLVTDSATQLEIEDAIVRLMDRRGNILDFDTTRKDGKAFLTLPGQKPGTTLELKIEKRDYNVKTVQLTVSGQLLEITPSQIGISLNIQRKTESTERLSIRNAAPYALRIKGISLQGNFKNLLDRTQTRNWLDSSYKGLVIEPKASQEIALKTFLSEDAQAITQRQDLEGKLVIIAENFGQEWLFEVPVKVTIGLGTSVDDPTCLVVTRSEWVTSTSGTPKRTEFQIQNNCTVDGKPVALRDLEAKLEWKTNQLGEYSLNFGADEIILRSGYYRLMLGTLQPEQAITAILTFTPFGGVNGVAQVDVVIQATNPLDEENQLLQNKIATEITTVNIAQCINYDKERLILNQGEIGAIVITADSSCGERIDFSVESVLNTSPGREFSLQPGESRTIEVFAEDNYPGQYGLLVSPKFASERREQDLKNLKVIVNAPGCWQLSKYEFDVYDDPENEFDGFDVARFTNTCVEKPVEVRVKTRDFTDALHDGLLWGLASAGITMLTNWSDNTTNIWGSPVEESNNGNGSAGALPEGVRPGTYTLGDEGEWHMLNADGDDAGHAPKATQDFLTSKYPGADTGTFVTVAITGSTATKQDTDTTYSPTGSLVLPPVQGLFSLFGGGRGTTGGLISGVGGLARGVLGTNPLGAGILGTAAGTFFSYSQQESEISFTTLQKDVEVRDMELVLGAGSLEQRDEDIELDAEGLRGIGGIPTVPQPLVNNPDLISQGIETFRAIFTNATQFITEQERPKYSQLKVTGIRHKYTDKTYEKDDFIDEEGGFLGFYDEDTLDKTKTKLDEDTPQQLEQRYNLEFNSVPPMVESIEPFGLLNCQAGTKLGSTGAEALPKVKFAWNWSEIGENACNEENPGAVYCDGTQFTIALMQKINEISEFVAENGSGFSCPSPREEEAAENEIGSFDIGIASVQVAKSGTEVDVIASVQNTNPGIIGTSVDIKAVPLGGGNAVDCPGGTQELSVGAGTREEARCTFTSLEEGFYEASVTITPSVSCENCEDVQATNALSRTFFSGETGLRQCEPYSTSRLDLFLQATGIMGAEADRLNSLTKFNALLMVDGYSTDFQRDFDVAQHKAFFDAPDYYTEEAQGLGVYFRDSKLFSFDAFSQPDFSLPGPGTYSVEIDIEYGDSTWRLFKDNGNPNAKITVRMEKLRGAEPDSPFYYLPLDGLVGADSGRVGYGVNFAGDSIVIDDSSVPLRTVEIPGSSPINDGTLSVTRSNSFSRMQAGNDRGTIARLSRTGGNPTLLFQPNHATPVILRIDKETTGDAYAIYQVEASGGAVDLGQTMTLWNGIGVTCRGFDDTVMAQQQFIPDTHGISARCALVGQNERTKYALEFCDDPINFGSVFYETIFYTPQEGTNVLQLTDAASDSAEFIAADEQGRNVFLSGNGATSRVTSLENVFSLVEQEFACVSGTNLNAEFFWNPKKVFETIQDGENEAINACITR